MEDKESFLEEVASALDCFPRGRQWRHRARADCSDLVNCSAELVGYKTKGQRQTWQRGRQPLDLLSPCRTVRHQQSWSFIKQVLCGQGPVPGQPVRLSSVSSQRLHTVGTLRKRHEARTALNPGASRRFGVREGQ